VTDPGLPTPPPSLPTGWGSSPVGPPPSTPVTPQTSSPIAAPTPPRKRWIVVLVAVLVLVFGIAIAGTTLFFTNTFPPLRAAYDFTNDLENGDVDGAYSNLCADLRGAGGRSDFDAFADSILDGLVSFDVNPFGVDRDGDRATVDFSTVHRGNRRTSLELVVVNEADDWRVCDVRYRSRN
jgi:hypothetical protein